MSASALEDVAESLVRRAAADGLPVDAMVIYLVRDLVRQAHDAGRREALEFADLLMTAAEGAQGEAGEPTAWDSAVREGRAQGLQEALGISYREAWLRAGRPAQNAPRGPDWMQHVAADSIRAAEQKLTDHMLSIDEDITDTALWVHRRNQLYGFLAEYAKHENGRRGIVRRHADHDAGLVCRPAGNGLCIPLEAIRDGSSTPLDLPRPGQDTPGGASPRITGPGQPAERMA